MELPIKLNNYGEKMENKIILIDSDEAAKEQTITVWISSNGRIYTDELAARYDGCTHRYCIYCGEPCLKRWLSCESCRAKQHEWRMIEFKEKNT
jgi:hypothetical protein